MSEIESKIGKKFDELSGFFPEDIDKDDIRVKIITNFFGKLKNKKVLDVGCGKGRFSKILIKKRAKVTGIDISEKMIKEARKIKGGKFKVGSVTKISFPDNHFDCVFSVELLEHVPNTRKAIKEMVRVLKPNGKIIIIDKNKFAFHRKLIFSLMGSWTYSRKFPFREKWFSRNEIEKILSKYCRKTKSKYLGVPIFSLFLTWLGIK